MNIKQVVVASLSAGLIALQALVAPHGSALAPNVAAGDIAGYTVTPPGSVTQVSMSVVVPAATTSPDCDTPGQFEYAIFGIRLTANTFATVSATCGNQGNVAYFADIEAGSGAAFKNFLLRPGQTVSLSVTVNGTQVTVTASRGRTFKKVSADPADAPYPSVGLGGWDIPGNLLPVLTTNARFSSVMVNNTSLVALSSVRTALTNGSVVTMRPTAVNTSGGFTDLFLRQG
jgi:hypothetical protein